LQTNYTIHIVESGDTIVSLSQRYGLEYDAISKLNRLAGELAPRYVGKRILIPSNEAYLRDYNSQYWEMGQLGLNVTSRRTHAAQACVVQRVGATLVDAAAGDAPPLDDNEAAWSVGAVAHKTLHHWAPFDAAVPQCSASAPRLARWTTDGGVECLFDACPPTECSMHVLLGNEPEQLPVFLREAADMPQRVCTPAAPRLSPLRAEYVRVECRCGATATAATKDTRHLDLLVRAVQQPQLLKERPHRSWFANDNDAPQQQQQQQHGESNLDVLVVIIDSVSRQHFLRSAPRSASLLEEWHLDATTSSSASSSTSHELIQLLGYNVVGRGTYNNLGKLYAGLPTYDEGEDKRELLWKRGFFFFFASLRIAYFVLRHVYHSS
jgi:hypothetical protein